MAKKKAKKAVKKATKKTVKKSVKKATKKAVKKVVKKAVKKPVKKVVKKKPVKAAAKKPLVAAKPKSTSINPYLTFAGNCEEAFNFYKSVFGGNFSSVSRFKEMPPMDGYVMSAEESEKIMHISLPISEGYSLMGSDSSDAFGHATVIGNNFSISINAVSQSSADNLYARLSDGGVQTMPMNKTFWGSYYGMCTDKYGIQWMISFE